MFFHNQQSLTALGDKMLMIQFLSFLFVSVDLRSKLNVNFLSIFKPEIQPLN